MNLLFPGSRILERDLQTLSHAGCWASSCSTVAAGPRVVNVSLCPGTGRLAAPRLCHHNAELKVGLFHLFQWLYAPWKETSSTAPK